MFHRPTDSLSCTKHVPVSTATAYNTDVQTGQLLCQQSSAAPYCVSVPLCQISGETIRLLRIYDSLDTGNSADQLVVEAEGAQLVLESGETLSPSYVQTTSY